MRLTLHLQLWRQLGHRHAPALLHSLRQRSDGSEAELARAAVLRTLCIEDANLGIQLVGPIQVGAFATAWESWCSEHIASALGKATLAPITTCLAQQQASLGRSVLQACLRSAACGLPLLPQRRALHTTGMPLFVQVQNTPRYACAADVLEFYAAWRVVAKQLPAMPPGPLLGAQWVKSLCTRTMHLCL